MDETVEVVVLPILYLSQRVAQRPKLTGCIYRNKNALILTVMFIYLFADNNNHAVAHNNS